MCDGITAEALAQRRREGETGRSVRENAGDLGERELLRIPTAQQIPQRCQSALSPFCPGRGRGGLVSGWIPSTVLSVSRINREKQLLPGHHHQCKGARNGARTRELRGEEGVGSPCCPVGGRVDAR